MIKRKKDNNLLKTVKPILLCIVVIIIGLFFMSKKEDLDFDEVGTFGLANNTFQLDIEDFKEYKGEELLLKYASVKDGEEFNISNVFFNQEMDTHPPLYYLVLNFLCSIRKGTFSMWYGLIINLLYMVVLFFELKYLFNLVIKDEKTSIVLSLLSFFTYGFINEIVFIRMYVQLSILSMGFAILVINKINSIIDNKKADLTNNIDNNNDKTIKKSYSENDFKFLIKFFVICVLGILTQYHFVIVAFYFSLVLAIFLIHRKEFRLLLETLVVGIMSIITSLIIFPGIINHLFGRSSLHALNGQRIDTLSTRFYEILMTITRAFFGVGIYPYIVILFIILIISLFSAIKNKETIKQLIANNIWYFIILLCAIYYYVIISLTVTFTFARYLYNIYPLIVISIMAPIYLLFKSINHNLKYLSIVVLIVLAFTSIVKEEPFSLNMGQNMFYEFLTNNKDTKILALYRSIDKNGRNDTMNTSLWKIQRPLYTFRSMESISFVDISKNEDILYREDSRIANNEKLFLVIYTGENDDEILGGLMSNNGFSVVDRVIRTTYYNMYQLLKQ